MKLGWCGILESKNFYPIQTAHKSAHTKSTYLRTIKPSGHHVPKLQLFFVTNESKLLQATIKFVLPLTIQSK